MGGGETNVTWMMQGGDFMIHRDDTFYLRAFRKAVVFHLNFHIN